MKTQLSITSLALPLLAVLLSLATVTAAQVTEHKLTASDGEEGDHFGNSVSLSGTRALVGAVRDDSDRGSAYVYERQGDGSWLEVDKITGSDGAERDFFGGRVSLVGDRALVGAIGDDDLGSLSGSAYVFERQGDGSWLEVFKLNASDGATDDNFGVSVSLSEDRALIGAFEANPLPNKEIGSAYVFERQGDGSWQEVAKLTTSDEDEGDFFGWSVSLSGDRALVGAPEDDDDGDRSGSVYVFERQGDGSWLEVDKLTASDGAAGDFFGVSVSLSGDHSPIGKYLDSERASSAGAAYLFERLEDGSWTESVKLTATDGSFNDNLGRWVSLQGGRALLAAPGFDVGRGAAYVFENFFPTAIETSSDLPQGYLLSAPYPNPFNPRAVVPFEVPEAAHVQLTLVDIFGREVAILLNRQVGAGTHEAVLDGGRLASGVYLVRLEAEAVVQATQKVLLLR